MKQYTSWVEVNESAIKHNLSEIRNKLNPKRILAVVKANAYGHGAVRISQLLENQGINYLGVSLAEEALILRKNQIRTPILILGPVLPEMLTSLLQVDCTLTISNIEQIQIIDQVAANLNKSATVHLNINTGMNRYGANLDDIVSIIKKINKADNIKLEGVYTHFSQAENSNVCQNQYAMFIKEVRKIENLLDYDIIVHCANSIASVKYPEMHLDMVRIGSLLFGQSRVNTVLDLKKSWCLKTKIINIISVKKGQTVGYGNAFSAKKNMRVAIVPLGFHHGVSMWPNHTSVTLKTAIKNIAKEVLKILRNDRVIEKALIGTKEVPYIGKTGMEHLALDISSLSNVKVGDIVSLKIIQTSISQTIPIAYKKDE